jgi:SAM-dependent methyltransferase
VKADEYAKMYRAETEFWWFAGKGRLMTALAARWLAESGPGLDVGCGTGANLERMRGRGDWTGLDASAEALTFCAERGHGALVAGDAGRLPFATGSFTGVTALDLLEHLGDDAAAAAELYRVLRPGGRLIVTVPAYPGLWSAHDEAMGHVRRYRRAGLRRLLSGAGFEVRWLSYFLFFLAGPMAAVKLGQRRWGNPSETMSYTWPGWINRGLLVIVEAEVRLMRFLPLPAGTTLVAVGEKP